MPVAASKHVSTAMQAEQHARHVRTKGAVALLLSFAAGCVDMVGFLTLYHTFTAHMSGATVDLGQDLLQEHWSDAASAGCVIATFLLGSIVGRTLIEIGARRHVRRIASATLLLEAGLIAAVVPLAPDSRHFIPMLALLAMLAGAMGLQTATLTRVGSLTVHTTFVTGMLNKLAQLLSHVVFLTYDRLRRREISSDRRKVFRRTAFISGIWCLYLAGAAIGTWTTSSWGTRSLLLPACAVGAVIIVDQVLPLSIEEERDETER